MDYAKVLSQDPSELLNWLLTDFTVALPSEILTIEDMNDAAKLLLKLSANFSYVTGLLSAAKIAKRDIKRSGTTEEYQDMVDRSDIIQNVADIIKQQYAAVSRAVTIHMENNNELRMTATGGVGAVK